MKKALLLTMAILCCAGIAFAQPPGAVAVYGDSAGTTCEKYDNTGANYQYMDFYFVHVADVPATAVEFQFDASGLTYGSVIINDCPWLLKLGTFLSGMSISYGSCQPGAPGYGIYLGHLQLKHGALVSNHCAKVYTKNHPVPGIPGATTPLAAGCPTGWLVLHGSFMVVSDDFTECPCPGTVPTTESSWGKIKALYE
jgi:hypothetical protein